MNELLCLQCPLFTCNEDDPGCLLRPSVEEEKLEAKRAYNRAWYAKHRESRIAWQKEYTKNRDRSEYYRERYKRRKDAQQRSTKIIESKCPTITTGEALPNGNAAADI